MPPICPLCRRVGEALCARCAERLVPALALAPPTSVDECASLLSYEGAARPLITALKYRNNRSVARWLATGMTVLARPMRVDLVTWAPTSDARRSVRGFDQAQILARHVAAHLGIACQRLLVRHEGPPQTGLTRDQRLHAPRFGLNAAGRDVAGARVLVVDDVITSGATLTAAARALKSGAVPAVAAVSAARTPRSHVVRADRSEPVYHPGTSPQAGG